MHKEALANVAGLCTTLICGRIDFSITTAVATTLVSRFPLSGLLDLDRP
jgi:hypothetical protein